MRGGGDRADAGPDLHDTILQVDPRAGYRAQREAIDAAIAGVLLGGSYVLGERVAAFETAFAGYLGLGHAVGVANGTDAIALALRALGVGPGDRVATVAHTAVATVAAIAMAGASPLLVDIDPVRCTMDPSRLEDALAAVPVAAVVLVHLYGQPADIDAIASIARRHGAALVEDCAQAHGAAWRGRRVGGFGDAAAFSFYPTKNLGSFGDGGLVATDDPAIAERVRALRQYGWSSDRVSTTPGVNSRLHELQAAVLGVRLAHLDLDNARRRDIADRYDTLLAATGLQRPARIEGCEPVFHQYVIRTAARDRLRAALQAQGIGTGIHYPVPVHRQPAYRDVAIGPGGLPCTERAAASVLSLPMYPQLSDEQVLRAGAAIAQLEAQLL